MGLPLSKKAFADMIGKSDRWVTKLIDEGLPVQGGGGRGKALQIDSEEGIAWLVKEAVAKATGLREGDEPPPEGTKEAADLRFAQARAEEKELQVKLLDARSIDLSLAVSVLNRLMAIMAKSLDGIASGVADDLSSETDPAVVREVLLDEVRRIRAEIADLIRDWVAGCRADSGVDSEAAAEEDC